MDKINIFIDVVVMIGLYTHKVKRLSTTSLYTNWAENYKKTGHFHQKYWKSRKIAHFVTSLWHHWYYQEIFNTHSWQDMCLWNTDAPGDNKVKTWKKSLSPTFLPCPQPRGACDVSEVWGTHRWTGQTDRQMDRQTDGRTIRLLDAPGWPSRLGA